MSKYNTWVNLLRLGRKTRTRRQNMAEIVFRRGVSEIQCIIFKQNNVNPYGIYNICVEINIVLHSRIIFFREKENLISACNISDLMHSKTPAQAFTPPAEKKIGTKWTFTYIHATAQAGENIK